MEAEQLLDRFRELAKQTEDLQSSLGRLEKLEEQLAGFTKDLSAKHIRHLKATDRARELARSELIKELGQVLTAQMAINRALLALRNRLMPPTHLTPRDPGCPHAVTYVSKLPTARAHYQLHRVHIPLQLQLPKKAYRPVCSVHSATGPGRGGAVLFCRIGEYAVMAAPGEAPHYEHHFLAALSTGCALLLTHVQIHRDKLSSTSELVIRDLTWGILLTTVVVTLANLYIAVRTHTAPQVTFPAVSGFVALLAFTAYMVFHALPIERNIRSNDPVAWATRVVVVGAILLFVGVYMHRATPTRGATAVAMPAHSPLAP